MLVVRHAERRLVDVLESLLIRWILIASNGNAIAVLVDLCWMSIYFVDEAIFIIIIFLYIERCSVDTSFAVHNVIFHRLPLGSVAVFERLQSRTVASEYVPLSGSRSQAKTVFRHVLKILFQFLFHF